MFFGWVAVYPASLHLVALCDGGKAFDGSRRRGLRLMFATACCVCALFWRLQPQVTFGSRNHIVLLIHAFPFLTHLVFSPLSWPVVDFWMLRDCFIAPVIEELYYRQLLPMLAPKPRWLWSSAAFALAHVLGTQERSDTVSKLAVTFVFGCLQHLLAAQTSVAPFSVSIGALGCLAFAHGLANFVGIPLHSEDTKAVRLAQLQRFILFIVYPLILFICHYAR